eukprot:SAG31_NODE_4199_length_3480_cov_4.559302_6_plen_262_part_00
MDGISLTAAPTTLIASKQYNRGARVLIGSNRDEFAFMTISQMPPRLTEQEMSFTVKMNPPWFYRNSTLYSEFETVYAPDNYDYPAEAFVPDAKFSIEYWMTIRSGTDQIPGLGACAVRWFDRLLLNGGSPAVYSYLFAHPPRGNPVFGPNIFASHTAELGFVFDKPYGGAFPGLKNFTDEEAALADAVSRYWLEFVRTGDPNPSDAKLPTWPQYKVQEDAVLLLRTKSEGGITTIKGLRRSACDWQEKIMCQPPSATCRSE